MGKCKGVRIEGENGNYKAFLVNVYDANGELDEDLMEDTWLFDEEVKRIYAVEYNGEIYYPIFSSWEELEDEFEDVVVDALKKDGYFQEIEYSDDPDDDDEATDIRLFTFDI